MISSKKTINKDNGHYLSVSDKLSDKNKIVLVGLMGAGKTSIGHHLATYLGLPFIDADDEIEKALWILKEDMDLPTEEVQKAVDSRKIKIKDNK